MNKELPIYELDIDEAENMIVDWVSIVEHPAIERNFLAFSKENKDQITGKFDFSNNDKMQLLGVAAVPDELIYRYQKNEEFYVKITKEKIQKIVHVFMKNGLTKNLNIEHTEKNAGSYIFNTIIVDENFNAPEKLGDVPIGSWVIGVQVEDKEVWQDIKDGKRNGFSIEGLFKLLLTDFIDKDEIVDIDITEVEDNEEIKMKKVLNNYFDYVEKMI